MYIQIFVAHIQFIPNTLQHHVTENKRTLDTSSIGSNIQNDRKSAKRMWKEIRNKYGEQSEITRLASDICTDGKIRSR